MQYNKDEFKYYYSNYKDIKDRIEETKNIINGLLQDDKLTKTISFYNNLSSSDKKIFDDINCNIDFIRYKLNQTKIDELEKGLESLYDDFIKSEAFPFPIDEFHFFVRKNNYLTDAITDLDSSELSDKENMLLNDSIVNVFNYNPNDYNEDDIPLIKVLYLKNKDNLNKDIVDIKTINKLIAVYIDDDAYVAKNHDKNIFSNDELQCNYAPLWKIKLWNEKLYNQQQRVLNSDSKNKELLLFSIRCAFYEIELLSGINISSIYNKLSVMDVKNNHERRKKEIEIDALITAYYHLIDDDFRRNSGYYTGNNYMFANYETGNKEINKRLLKLMKR